MSIRICGNIVQPDGVLEGGALVVGDSGLIEEIDAVSGSFQSPTIVPGFIDIHVHGGGGADFMDGTVESVRTVARTHARFGTTTMLATTLTATGEQISRCIAAVRAVMNDPGPDEARIAGIHLEGPFLCPAKRGAQPLAPIRKPNWDEMAGWIDESGGAIRVITLAPELDGAIDFIKKAASAGVIVSIGHTEATFEQTVAAIEAGASHATHLFNAMPPLNHRAPGAAGALIASETAFAETIADGVHLHPGAVKIAVSAMGPGRIVLITDAMSGAAMPDGDYELGGQRVRVSGPTARFDDGTLAGSILTMNRAFENILRFAAVSPMDAANMTASNAADRLGLAKQTGRIAVGLGADLTLLDPDSGRVEATMRDGKWLWRA
jgi:N-acetylglucosamine-6-phosphate deacetylase